MRSATFALLFIAFGAPAYAKIKVVTTTETMREMAEKVGGSEVEVVSLLKGAQDPHHTEAKPSFMVTLRDAQLVISVGLDLESAWLPNVIQGSRNPKLRKGEKGYFELGTFANPIEIPISKVDRSAGDVHPFGNPHFYLDPSRLENALLGMADRYSKLLPAKKDYFLQNAQKYIEEMRKQDQDWKQRLKKFSGQNVITYHRTLNYLLQHFGLELASTLEPKPGIPPSAKHLADVIDVIKEKNINCILIESFFDESAGKKIQEATGRAFVVVPTEVGATAESETYLKMMEFLVKTLETCLAGAAPKG